MLGQCKELPHRLRKIRKRRGSRVCGWGRVGQHRKGGSRGGRGYSGKTDVKFMSYYNKLEPKKGFVRKPRSTKLKTINVGELKKLMQMVVVSESGRVLDLASLGYQKLLGGGEPSLDGVKLIVPSWTARAEQKLALVSCTLERPGTVQ